MEESPELAALKKEFLEKSEKVREFLGKPREERKKETNFHIDLHFGDITPEIIETLDEEDVLMWERIGAARTFEEFEEAGSAFDSYIRNVRQAAKSNILASIFYKAFCGRAMEILGDELAFKILLKEEIKKAA